jgi:GntR family transcriptional regulator
VPLDPDAVWAAMVEELEPSRDRKLSSRTLSDACTRVLRAVLRGDGMKAGEKLPSEHELAQIFQVSRVTVREALRTLEGEKLISRRRGIGTVVLPNVIRKDLSFNFGITAMISNAGHHEKIEEIAVSAEDAELEVASALGLNVGDKVLKLDRVRVVEEQPIVWSMDWLSGKLMSLQMLERFAWGEFGITSIYDFLKDHASHAVVRGAADLQAIAATGRVAEKLRSRRGSPVMKMTQTDFDEADMPVLYSIEYHLPDAVQFHLQRLGPFS